jgi:hypothetical protein
LNYLVPFFLVIFLALSQTNIKSSQIVLEDTSRTNMALNISGLDTTKREEIKQYWQKEEIDALERAVIKQKSIIHSCYNRFKKEMLDKRGFIKVKFEIQANGKLDKKSVELISTSLKHKELISCLLKRVKYFKNFKPASYSLAKNYVFEKKWNF